MSALVEIHIDGERHQVPEGIPVAVALLRFGITTFRISSSGTFRGPVCGMGTCFECRVTIDGVMHRRACLIPVTAGLVIETARP